MKAIRHFVDRRIKKRPGRLVKSPAERYWDNQLEPQFNPNSSFTLQSLEARLARIKP